MYRIFADKTLIYDSELEDYKIGKGQITLEVNKSGSFVFSVYPDHFFYDQFIKLKTIITVYKGSKIVFRGRILNEVTDYWNNKVITCEGELGFLRDSIIRPFSFNGRPAALLTKFVEEHNAQVDEDKRFRVGEVTVPDQAFALTNPDYETGWTNLTERLMDDLLGGYISITHEEYGGSQIPTLNYLSDFTKVSTQGVEFGSNLKRYTKTVKAEDIATAIIPLGHEIDDDNPDTDDPRLTIASVTGGVDYVFDEEAVRLYGWITKVMIWDDITDAATLRDTALDYLQSVINQTITIELNAIDLSLLDRSIESFAVGDYIPVTSAPHNFDAVMLCNKQVIDLLRPDNDSLVLGNTYSTFTDMSSKQSSSFEGVANRVLSLATTSNKSANNAVIEVGKVSTDLESVQADIEAIYQRLEALEGGGQ